MVFIPHGNCFYGFCEIFSFSQIGVLVKGILWHCGTCASSGCILLKHNLVYPHRLEPKGQVLTTAFERPHVIEDEDCSSGTLEPRKLLSFSHFVALSSSQGIPEGWQEASLKQD